MKIISEIEGKNLVVSPLDWGLGHAARIVPVIRELQKKNNVLVVCGPCAYQFMKSELPDTEIVEINDKKIRYPKSEIGFFTILSWVPVVVFNSINEHVKLTRIIRRRNIDAVISDNRYGLIFKNLDCYIVTHQVCPRVPPGFGFMERFSNWIFKKYLSKFKKVLIPDFETGFSLTGLLAADRELDPEKFVRIGVMSRFAPSAQPEKNEYDFLVLISGQESQRTVFENLLLQKLANARGKILFVRGVSSDAPRLENFGNVEFCNMLTGKDLERAMKVSATIVCRAGYSTICDVVALNKNAIIIPTPGQTEQEYLAGRLDGKFGFKSLRQNELACQDIF